MGSPLRALIQRVAQASVSVGDRQVSSIGPGLVVLLGVSAADTEADARYLVEKIVNLRIFADAQNRFNHSAQDTGAELLVVSQFTLYAETRKGRRPDFTRAAPPELAQRLYQGTVELFQATGLPVSAGVFQEYMQVSLQNDGPVTLMLDSADRQRSLRSS